MQDELTQAGFDVTILGVNAIGLEAGNPSVTAGRDLAWLQDVPEESVWESWDVTYRDVIILDADNVVVGIYNVTQHNLSDPANYAELRAAFEAAATP
jgi:hypothetical protein